MVVKGVWVAGDKAKELCDEISSISNGVCFLSFSRGKDSIASWIVLKQYFKRIIPFHCSFVPNLNFVNESLDYYERFFDAKIQRFIIGSMLDSIYDLWFQAIEDEDSIDEFDFPKYGNNDVLKYLRIEHDLHNAWCAYGINSTDSIDRRIYVNKYQGKNDKNKSFYPCFNYTRQEIIEIIKNNKVKLPDDYKYTNRTISTLGFRGLENLSNMNIADFKKIETLYPFARAIIARNVFRRQNPTTTISPCTESGKSV